MRKLTRRVVLSLLLSVGIANVTVESAVAEPSVGAWFPAYGEAAEAALGASTPATGGEFFGIGESKIYYEQCGRGTPLVLLHDGLLPSVTWDEVWKPLCTKYRVIRYDRRGYGRSDVPKQPFSPVDDLKALLARLSVQRCIIIGNSSGGALAIDFAIAHPEMVDGLLLISPVVHGMRDSAYFIERGEKNNAPLEKDDVNGAAKNWSNDPFLFAPGDQAARQRFYEALAQNPKDLKYPGNLELRPSPPSIDRLSEITAPTLIVVGESDIADVHADCGAIQAAVRDSRREVFKNAGHLVQMEQPDQLIARIDTFVTQVGRKEVEVPPEILQSYAGQYKIGNGVLTFSVKNGHLTGQFNREPVFILHPASDGKFFLRWTDTRLAFERDATGKVAQAIVYEGGDTTRCPRI